MKMGDLYEFQSHLLSGCLGIDEKDNALGVFIKQAWDGDSKIYEFYFPLHNTKLWFRESELHYAKRLSQED